MMSKMISLITSRECTAQMIVVQPPMMSTMLLLQLVTEYKAGLSIGELKILGEHNGEIKATLKLKGE
jgi:hypothetical protein